MSIRFKQTVQISPDALFQEVSGEMVILDLRSESYFGLDAVGKRIWQLIQVQEDLQQVFDQMLDEFDVEAEQLEQDMSDLFDDLSKAGLVTIEDQVQNEELDESA